MKWLEHEAFEGVAAEYQYQMILILKEVLKRHGVEGDHAKDICGKFAFDLGVLHDQGEIKLESKEYQPLTVFYDFDGNALAGSEEFQ